MHSEFYRIEEDQAKLINETHAKGGQDHLCRYDELPYTGICRRIENGMVKAGSGWTDIFIYPGYTFKVMDGLITNFHLPESTLMMLVSAFAGKENISRAYEAAVQERYRFFSFGDAMCIL